MPGKMLRVGIWDSLHAASVKSISMESQCVVKLLCLLADKRF